MEMQFFHDYPLIYEMRFNFQAIKKPMGRHYLKKNHKLI